MALDGSDWIYTDLNRLKQNQRHDTAGGAWRRKKKKEKGHSNRMKKQPVTNRED